MHSGETSWKPRRLRNTLLPHPPRPPKPLTSRPHSLCRLQRCHRADLTHQRCPVSSIPLPSSMPQTLSSPLLPSSPGPTGPPFEIFSSRSSTPTSSLSSHIQPHHLPIQCPPIRSSFLQLLSNPHSSTGPPPSPPTSRPSPPLHARMDLFPLPSRRRLMQR